MNPVSIITIKDKVKLYKKDEEASKIELLVFEEVGFEVVAQKDLYDIGEKVVFIQPDYSLSETSLFQDYIRPNGDEKLSKLGSNKRIRAIKFNLHRGDNQPVYSQGIVISLGETEEYLDSINVVFDIDTLAESLGITKWEATEEKTSGGIKSGSGKAFPKGLYRTDENNINNLWNKIEFPLYLIGTEKIDGSSITLFYKNGEYGICSRNLLKPLTKTKVVGKKEPSILDKIKMWFGKKIDLSVYEEVQSTNDFVKYGKPYLDKLVKFCKENNWNITLRGELNGKGLTGSGNKNNPCKNEEPNIKFYGADYYDDYMCIKHPDSTFDNIIDNLHFERCKVVFKQMFTCREDLENTCIKYFKDNLIEGIVVRDEESKFSAKIMNPEYDSKK